MSVRTSHTSPPALATTTCTSLPFTRIHHPFSCSTSGGKNHHALGTNTTRSTKKRRNTAKPRGEATQKNADQVCVTLWTPDVLGQGPARQSCGADAGFSWHRRVKSLWIHLLWGAGPVCSTTEKKGPAVHSNKAAISSWPLRRAIESAVHPDAVVTALSGPAARRVITTSLWPK